MSPMDDMRPRRVIQAVADLARRPLRDLRILDLACLSGYFAIEFATHGAQVVGIDLASIPEVDWPEKLEDHLFIPPEDYKPGKRKP